jgi:hypothetical protein
MVRPKLVKNGAPGIGHISGVVVVACLIFGWSCPSFSGEPAAAPDDQPHLQFAPINLSHSVGGNIYYVFQRNTSGPNESMHQSIGALVNVGVSVKSFFWQPWLALVSSSLSVGVGGIHTNSDKVPAYTSVSKINNGEAALNLVKYSRFPFEVRIFRQGNSSDSNYSGTKSEFVLSGYNLRQNYRSINRKLVGYASFTSSKSDMLNISPTYSDQFAFNLKISPSLRHTFWFDGYDGRGNQVSQGRSLNDGLVANYAYQPNIIFSVASVANLVRINNSTLGNNPQQYDAHSLQFNTFASLRPEKSPLTVTSGVRFYRSDSSANGLITPTLTSSSFNLGANYLFSPLIRMYGSVNVDDSLGTQVVSTSAALAAAKNYRASTNIGSFRYSGSIGGSLGFNNTTTNNSINQTSTQSVQRLVLYLSHALDKKTEFSAGHLSENLHQTITTSVNSNGVTVANLNSGGFLAWNRREGKENTMLRLGAADSRYLVGSHNSFQMVNLTASRSETMSRNESLLGSLSMQASHSQLAGQNNSNTITPSASLSYRHDRAFKVLHLSFQSLLRIDDTNIAPTKYQGNEDQATRSWENNFTYKIGRLNTQLRTRIATVNNTPQSSIMLSMDRPF